MQRLASLLILAAPLFAQISAQAPAQTSPQPARGPDGGTSHHISGIEVPPVPGRPFAGKDTIDWIRPLTTGNTVTSHIEANVARDSQGRIYRERHHFSLAGSDSSRSLFETIVSDPVAHTRTACNYIAHRCLVTALNSRGERVGLPEPGSFNQGRISRTRESLGANTVDNLPVQGSRETVTLAPGTVGNDQALTITREFWYSPDLGINLSVIRVDPREGTETIRLAILSRVDPDPRIFAIPAGFTVRNER